MGWGALIPWSDGAKGKLALVLQGFLTSFPLNGVVCV